MSVLLDIFLKPYKFYINRMHNCDKYKHIVNLANNTNVTLENLQNKNHPKDHPGVAQKISLRLGLFWGCFLLTKAIFALKLASKNLLMMVRALYSPPKKVVSF